MLDAGEIKAWRSDALRYVVSTPQYAETRTLALEDLKYSLEFRLLEAFPVLKHARSRFDNLLGDVVEHATKFAISLQTAPAQYEFRPTILQGRRPADTAVSKDHVAEFVIRDLDSQKVLTRGSSLVPDKDGVLNDWVLSVEPALVRIGANDVILQKESLVIKLKTPLAKRIKMS